ncbi:MAG: signal peptidase II [Chloroflexi bacterium]|nr:signal peptidase II [Chloroflexota bacterium]
MNLPQETSRQLPAEAPAGADTAQDGQRPAELGLEMQPLAAMAAAAQGDGAGQGASETAPLDSGGEESAGQAPRPQAVAGTAPAGAIPSSDAAPREESARRAPLSNARAWLYDLYLAGLIILTFVVDQSSKAWIRGHLYLGESVPQTGFFRLTHTFNTGSAFGLFPNQTFLLMLASIVGIGILLLYFRSQAIPPFWLRTSLGLQLGGAAGNLVDRITLGRVTDFFDVGPWPVFNLADSSILVGIGILAWFIWRTPKDALAKRPQFSAAATGDETEESPPGPDTAAVSLAAGARDDGQAEAEPGPGESARTQRDA